MPALFSLVAFIIPVMRFSFVSTSRASCLFPAPHEALGTVRPVEKAVLLVSQLVSCVDLSLFCHRSLYLLVYSEFPWLWEIWIRDLHGHWRRIELETCDCPNLYHPGMRSRESQFGREERRDESFQA